ncbi:hypothetical protein AVEN_260299-1 [Araneus ventricosus]|uniref:Uncharacterized protein n=1 Tax=Araneus ventricosus TaxID=182803 RepID=A0A4Y2J365_ARAVE|nr:hypothetical protein AVEN_260299-1 [Araneus ventricosus]
MLICFLYLNITLVAYSKASYSYIEFFHDEYCNEVVMLMNDNDMRSFWQLDDKVSDFGDKKNLLENSWTVYLLRAWNIKNKLLEIAFILFQQEVTSHSKLSNQEWRSWTWIISESW